LAHRPYEGFDSTEHLAVQQNQARALGWRRRLGHSKSATVSITKDDRLTRLLLNSGSRKKNAFSAMWHSLFDASVDFLFLTEWIS
jgi:hypothetical protein